VANEGYLTELILAIQNEVQTAVDYIGLAAAQAGTELGKNDAIMQIENLRVKIPFMISLESKNLNVGNAFIVTDLTTPYEMRKMLSTRKGFMLDLNGTGIKANFTKVKVDLNPTQESDGAEKACGELEITFSPLQRR